MRLTHILIFLVAVSLMTGCSASIPPESVELSQLVGEMIASSKVSHVSMVNEHFDHLRSEVENFAMSDYKEAFLTNVRELARRQNSEFVELTIPQYDQCIAKINKKRDEWVEQVETNRRKVLVALEEHYTMLTASNAEVTSLLRSAAKLSESRGTIIERLGQKIGISGAKIKEMEDQLIQGTNIVRSLMNTALQQTAVQQIGG